MPLIRFQVRNEFGLGAPELYRFADKDDPKGNLEGIAVSGLVGILRLLGDLAQFSAEIFHDLHQEVAATAARSRKMKARVQTIEAALPPLEKAMAAQRSHIHFAYTVGLRWHPDILIEQNLLSRGDLPLFIVDTYEECREPPHLFMLDRFDPTGAGACLKRYSDPSYFKRVCASLDLMKAGKAHKEKMAHGHKRKGSKCKHRHISRSASASRRHSSGRFQIGSFNTSEGHLSSGGTSAFNMAPSSDFAHQSTSIDSRSSLGYIEHDLSSNSSIGPKLGTSITRFNLQPAKESRCFDSENSQGNTEHVSSPVSSLGIQEQEWDGLSTPSFRMMDNDDRLSPHSELNEDAELQNSFNKSLPEQIALRSSSVSWDEKQEIVDLTCQEDGSILENLDPAFESLSVSIAQSKLDATTSSQKTSDQNDILCDVETVPELISSENHFYEINSETDNYMDALNTIDSEVDTDSECQTKREVEPEVNLDPLGVQSRRSQTNGTSLQVSVSLESEYPDPSHTSLMDGMQPKSSYSLNAESPALLEPQSTVASTGPDNPIDSDLNRNTDSADLTMNLTESTDIRVPSGPQIRETESNKVIADPYQPHQSPNISDTCQVQIWTNGGLLGLEPSKPPDFSVSNVVKQIPQDSVSATSEIKIKKYEGSNDDISITGCPARELHQNNLHMSSGIAGLTYRFLRNGTWKKTSQPQKNSTEPCKMKDGVPITIQEEPSFVERKSLNGFVHRDYCGMTSMEQLQFGSPSPPLEHMKISFHPMSGPEISKLKLEFPGGSHYHESNHDVAFPAFQLLPESSFPLRDNGSESNDDTFCRSSPYMSDDPLSPCSYSNSEQWESGERNGSGDDEMYNILRRVSSSSSTSSAFGHDEDILPYAQQASEFGNMDAENGRDSLLSGPSVGPQSFVPFCASRKEEVELAGRYSDVEDPLDSRLLCSIEPLLPPPLPPLQWWITKPEIFLKVKPDIMSEISDQPSEQPVKESIPLEQQLPVPLQNKGAILVSNKLHTVPDTECQRATQQAEFSVKQPKAIMPARIAIEGTASLHNASMLDCQQVNGKHGLTQPTGQKDFNEEEDFLQQIRTKAFCLRSTAPTRPSTAPAPSTNVKIAAILEKANAIRQVVGSDGGGDDDNWSDT